MNKEQQIKDMADIATQVHNNSMAELAISQLFENENYVPSPIAIVNALYEAGYRKQSDTIKEFAEIAIKLIDSAINGAPYADRPLIALKVALRGIAKEHGVEVEK